MEKSFLCILKGCRAIIFFAHFQLKKEKMRKNLISKKLELFSNDFFSSFFLRVCACITFQIILVFFCYCLQKKRFYYCYNSHFFCDVKESDEFIAVVEMRGNVPCEQLAVEKKPYLYDGVF